MKAALATRASGGLDVFGPAGARPGTSLGFVGQRIKKFGPAHFWGGSNRLQ